MWKSVKAFSTQPIGADCPVHRIVETVNFSTLYAGPETFTYFLFMNVLKKSLSSTETIPKLVEKSVQIPVRLA